MAELRRLGIEFDAHAAPAALHALLVDAQPRPTVRGGKRVKAG
jgi:hypothetical protein